MLLSLGVSLFAIGLLMVGWAVLLNRRPRPPRWLSFCGDYYATVIVILLTLGATLGIRELASGQVNLVQVGVGLLVGVLGYGLWMVMLRLERKGPALRVMEGDISVPAPLYDSQMDPGQSRRAA
ncbi:MAG: hypothetical protein R3310_00430 [Candidatus Competibacteraceae bacterium]|nr:hypothetical protein [Candidatus Competibacteraceae bacterium]